MTFNHLIVNINKLIILQDDLPDMDTNKITFQMNTISELNTQIDFVLDKIFSFETNFVHKVKLLNLNELKMNVHYIHTYLSNSSISEFPIMNKYDNPNYSFEDNDDLRVRLSYE